MTTHSPANPNPIEAARYSELCGFQNEWRDQWWNSDFLELMCGRLELHLVREMLDLGCGAGHWGRTLARALSSECRVLGIDCEPSFCEQADAYAVQLGLSDRFRYREGRAENLPMPQASFDLVTCQTVLIHIRDVPAVLKEALRVLRPGGTLLAAEPNNLSGYFNSLAGIPGIAWNDVLSALSFFRTCMQGKIALGHGDSSIGERLAGLLASAGFADIRVWTNDRCPALFPPYDRRDQQVEIRQLTGWTESEIWFGFGPRDNARKFFLAGGGHEAEFDASWMTAMGIQKSMMRAVASGTYDAARSIPCYLVSGRKPG